MISVTNLCHPYGFINNLSFEVETSGHLIISGENGAGKSTLLKLLAGIEKPQSGKILVCGKNPGQLEKFHIGYVPQFSEGKGFSLSVEEVVGLGVKSAGFGNSLTKKRILWALEKTDSLDLQKRAFESLSGGEKQKVQLSRCLAQRARVWLLDEPTASLDKENRQMVMEILQNLMEGFCDEKAEEGRAGPTMIIVTHDPELEKLSGWSHMNLKLRNQD